MEKLIAAVMLLTVAWAITAGVRAMVMLSEINWHAVMSH